MNEALLDRLAAGLAPVRPSSARRDLARIAGFLALQVLIVFASGLERQDLLAAMGMMDFWLRLAGSSLIGLSASLATVRALGPADQPRLVLTLGAIGLAAAAAFVFLMLTPGAGERMAEEGMLEGMRCTKNVLFFALPLALLFAWMLSRGAPARPRTSAVAAAIAATGWGCAVFTLHCPHDGPAHTLKWIPLAFVLTTVTFGVGLRRFARW